MYHSWNSHVQSIKKYRCIQSFSHGPLCCKWWKTQLKIVWTKKKRLCWVTWQLPLGKVSSGIARSSSFKNVIRTWSSFFSWFFFLWVHFIVRILPLWWHQDTPGFQPPFPKTSRKGFSSHQLFSGCSNQSLRISSNWSDYHGLDHRPISDHHASQEGVIFWLVRSMSQSKLIARGGHPVHVPPKSQRVRVGWEISWFPQRKIRKSSDWKPKPPHRNSNYMFPEALSLKSLSSDSTFWGLSAEQLCC